MKEIRCEKCNKKLAEASDCKRLVIKCSRCKFFNNLSATSAANYKGAFYGKNTK